MGINRKRAFALLATLGAAAALTGAAPAPHCNLAAPSVAEAGPEDCTRAWMDRNLRLNDLLSVGTHNSYKQAIPEAVMALIAKVRPEAAADLDYAHRPLPEQLDAGARQIEIDIYKDPEGGRFLNPAGFRAAGLTLDPARRAALAEPGFKVMHVQDIDVLSSCVRLADCLGTVRRWSLAHPDHAPILLLFNAKSDPSTVPGGTAPLPFDTAAFDALDRTVRAIFPPGALITPDDVRGSYATLREAVLAGNWPRLGDARGKVLLALDEDAEKVAAYRGGRRTLEGRVFFVNADEAAPDAAYITINDPVADASRIRRAVAAGYLVRTRADADTHEARGDDGARRTAALASGAQYVSTDYIWPDARFPGGYRVNLPGGAAAVCNPMRMGDRCGGRAIETAGPASGAYLSAAETPDGLTILPPPPGRASPLHAADRTVFAQTRRLKGTPRWALAAEDVESDAFTHFACALGMKLTAGSAPLTARLLDRASTSSVVDPVKTFYRMPRPYLGTRAPICQPRTRHLAENGDFPSGHAAGGWMEALILAELVPDRATAILARGRAYGESRAICGAHSVSAVQAGWLAGAAATARLHGSAEFRAEMDAARAELVRIRNGSPAPDAGLCKAERAALAQAAY